MKKSRRRPMIKSQHPAQPLTTSNRPQHGSDTVDAPGPQDHVVPAGPTFDNPITVASHPVFISYPPKKYELQIEVTTTQELVQALKSAVKASNRQIKQLYFIGHGGAQGFTLSGFEVLTAKNLEDIRKKNPAVAELFDKYALIHLRYCSSTADKEIGYDRRIADTFLRLSGGYVTGFEEDFDVKSRNNPFKGGWNYDYAWRSLRRDPRTQFDVQMDEQKWKPWEQIREKFFK